MTPLTALAWAIALVCALVLFWRERSGRRAARERLRLEAARARELESTAADAANLLAGGIESLRLAREDMTASDHGEWVEQAYQCMRSTVALFEAARIHGLRNHRAIGPRSVEGAFRLAVAIARSEGAGIALGGRPSELEVEDHDAELVRAMARGLVDLSRRALKPGYVTVELGPDAVRLDVPVRDAPRVTSIESELRARGWRVVRTCTEATLSLELFPGDRGADASLPARDSVPSSG